MDYADFVRAQQDALIGSFMDDPAQCWIGVPALNRLNTRCRGGRWQSLAQVSPVNAVVYRAPDGAAELWVKPNDKAMGSNGAYRSHWQAYLQAMQVSGASSHVRGVAQNIDHLLPETFAARQGYAYVRVMAVDARSNLTVGSTIERSMAARDHPGASFLADWFTVAKASGFRGSFARSSEPGAVMSDLRRHLETRGFSVPAGQAPPSRQCMEAILRWSRSV